MKIIIVFHSVCGNTYLIAKEFRDHLSAAGHSVVLKRTADPDWVLKPGLDESTCAMLGEMRSLPEAAPGDLADYDLILMGCPVYFGNVTAEMKAFMDSTGGLWIKAVLAGKRFAAFTSGGNTEGGADLCLQALHIYAKYMGLLSVPLPVTSLPGENSNVMGIIHYSAGKYASELPAKTKQLIKNYCLFLSKT